MQHNEIRSNKSKREIGPRNDRRTKKSAYTIRVRKRPFDRSQYKTERRFSCSFLLTMTTIHNPIGECNERQRRDRNKVIKRKRQTNRTVS